jgi:calcineurin-like phosphoesterase family protein
MYKTTKHRFTDKERIFFSSDWHLFHEAVNWPIPIWKQRGYSSVEESNKDIQDKVNAKVGKDDYLYYLGDLALNATDDGVIEWMSGINCQNVMMLFGNHESVPFRLYRNEILRQFGRNDIEVYPLKINNMTFLGNHHEMWVGKQHIVMNHYSLHSWNRMGKLSWQLHGHSHCSDATRNPSHPTGKVLDCGWDGKKDVWTYAEIEETMHTKTFHAVDHHDRNAN